MSFNNLDNVPENAQILGSITGSGSATLTANDITGIPQDPVDMFRVSTSDSVTSLSFSFRMTTELAGLSSYLQYIVFLPVLGFESEETINFFTGSGEFDANLVQGEFGTGLGTSEPVTLSINPGEDVVFSITAVGYDYDNGTPINIDLGGFPGLPDIPNLPDGPLNIPNLLPIEYTLSVSAGSGSGSGSGGGGATPGGGGTGGGGSGGGGGSIPNIFDLASALTAEGLAMLVDYDGNNLGAIDSWLEIGRGDVQGDGDVEVFLINELLGRWATLGITADGKVDFSANGLGGDTRVVGIYEDPLVALGEVVAGGPFDSQTRFANDIASGNLGSVLGAGDYDGDGFQEVYFGLKDGTAVLHAYMHADGNIRYANYQSDADLTAFMEANGIAPSVYDAWI